MLLALIVFCHTPGIENLPFELQRNFNLMRDLDQRTEGEIICAVKCEFMLFCQPYNSTSVYREQKEGKTAGNGY